jgi:hypothetical protein
MINFRGKLTVVAPYIDDKRMSLHHQNGGNKKLFSCPKDCVGQTGFIYAIKLKK